MPVGKTVLGLALGRSSETLLVPTPSPASHGGDLPRLLGRNSAVSESEPALSELRSRLPRALALGLVCVGATVWSSACGGSSAKSRAPVPLGKRPSPAVRATIKVGTSPIAVAVGDGGVWVANYADGTITRIDPRTARVSGRAISVGAAPLAIATDRSGVWVATGAGRVLHIDPQTRRVVGPPIDVKDPAGIAVGDGTVWVTSRTSNAIIRINSTTARVSGAPIMVGSAPTDIAVDGDNTWVANSGDGTVSRIDAPSGRVKGPAIAVAHQRPLTPGGSQPTVSQPGAEILALTVGEDGVWVAKTDQAQTNSIQVVRIDPASDKVTTPPVSVTGGVPMRLAAGAGAVWATDIGNIVPPGRPRKPSLLNIDPASQRLAVTSLPVGLRPTGVAVGQGKIWVTNSGDNTVTEVAAYR